MTKRFKDHETKKQQARRESKVMGKRAEFVGGNSKEARAVLSMVGRPDGKAPAQQKEKH